MSEQWVEHYTWMWTYLLYLIYFKSLVSYVSFPPSFRFFTPWILKILKKCKKSNTYYFFFQQLCDISFSYLLRPISRKYTQGFRSYCKNHYFHVHIHRSCKSCLNASTVIWLLVCMNRNWNRIWCHFKMFDRLKI